MCGTERWNAKWLGAFMGYGSSDDPSREGVFALRLEGTKLIKGHQTRHAHYKDGNAHVMQELTMEQADWKRFMWKSSS